MPNTSILCLRRRAGAWSKAATSAANSRSRSGASKARDKPLTEGVGQAKDYAGKLAIRFTYASNGQGIYGIDMDTGFEAELAHYPTPDELWNRTFAAHDVWRDRFAAVPFEDRGGFFQGRYYQDIAASGCWRPSPVTSSASC